MGEKRAVLALNGDLQDQISEYKDLIKQQKQVQECVYVAADGGALLFRELGILPEIIIGDLDSLTEKDIEFFRSQEVKVSQFSVEKDKTDGELALDFCHRKGIKEISIIGALGGRYDQQLGNLFLLEYALKLGQNAVIKEPGIEIGLVEDSLKLENRPGKRLSLIPLTEEVRNVVIEGCKYNLQGEDLFRYRSRGLSNIIEDELALIKIDEGILIYLMGV
ncbi:MAG: thiamine diphosphokinase [Bacillota bacterium]